MDPMGKVMSTGIKLLLMENIWLKLVCQRTFQQALGTYPGPLTEGNPSFLTSWDILGIWANYELIPKPELKGFWGDSLTFHHHLGEFPTGGKGRYNLSRGMFHGFNVEF